MKRVAILIAVCFVSIICNAQEHLRFMDIPINGTLDSFVNKLVKDKGFSESKLSEDEEYEGFETRKLIGHDFEGLKDIKVMVFRMKEQNNVSSVTVFCDTTDYNFQQADKLINHYDSIYGKHKESFMLLVKIFRWELESGNIEILKASFLLNINFVDFTERTIKKVPSLESDEPLSLDDFMEKQTIKEICGIKFGTSYETAKEMLQNKYGYPEYSPDKTVITYKHKSYAGLMFDSIHFLFQSDGIHSYLNGCVFIMDAKTLSEAKKKQETLYNKLSEKYTMINNIDDNGNKYYCGGNSPIPDDTIGFTIDILKYESEIARQFSPYATRLMYGRYNYVKEEF